MWAMRAMIWLVQWTSGLGGRETKLPEGSRSGRGRVSRLAAGGGGVARGGKPGMDTGAGAEQDRKSVV